MKIKKIAVENYKKFCSFKGSDYIASEFALESLLLLIVTFKVKNILELGMGIGSVSDTILKFDQINNINYFGTENNDFCLKVLPQNVEHFKKITLVPELKYIKNKKFDLIIVDGLDESLVDIEKYCAESTILFMEGDRATQTAKILNIFPKSLYVNVITLEKNSPYGHEGGNIHNYKGGGQLFFINPTFQMRKYWFQQKVGTFIKRKIRIISGK
jgi:spore coat polysaccharide biosynthesis predicted glycosyltransferase SpsG